MLRGSRKDPLTLVLGDFSETFTDNKSCASGFPETRGECSLQGDSDNDFCKGHNSLTLEYA